ncbi:MAG: hypothetical protein CML21_00480 [Rheinheimera sp.]|nr:hypothetical protein [Rheinheimera sp.]|tara:strand:+ start:4235 stop:4783 length:549 start_codon:yes stop_codon:yes gene_type:complete
MPTQPLQPKLLPHERVQAAWRYLEPDARGTTASICKRYRMTEAQLKRAVSDFQKCRFTKSKNWNPFWDLPDTIHHVVDTSVMVDIEQGANKGSDIDLFMDPDFDPTNGLLHKQWTGMDKEALFEGLPFRILEILRDSRPGDELYQEAIAFTDCPLFKVICKAYGIDCDQLIQSALEITKSDI